MIQKMEWLLCMFLVFFFGCAIPEQEATATYTHDHLGIEFKYPEGWIVTDNDKGSSSSFYLVVSSTPFSPLQGAQGPSVQLLGFRPADMSIIAKRIQSFKDEGINYIESQTKIGGRNATKFESEILVGEDATGKSVFYVIDETDISLLILTGEYEYLEASDADAVNAQLNIIIESLKIN